MPRFFAASHNVETSALGLKGCSPVTSPLYTLRSDGAAGGTLLSLCAPHEQLVGLLGRPVMTEAAMNRDGTLVLASAIAIQLFRSKTLIQPSEEGVARSGTASLRTTALRALRKPLNPPRHAGPPATT